MSEFVSGKFALEFEFAVCDGKVRIANPRSGGDVLQLEALDGDDRTMQHDFVWSDNAMILAMIERAYIEHRSASNNQGSTT